MVRKNIMHKKSNRESGTIMVEYALSLSILVGTFLAAGIYITDAAKERAGNSTNAIRKMVPCGAEGLLTAEECY